MTVIRIGVAALCCGLALVSLGAIAHGEEPSTDPAPSGEVDDAAPPASEDAGDDTASFDDLADDEVIVVTGSRVAQPLSAATVATDVIGRREIEASGSQNVAEILEEHPAIRIEHALRGREIRMNGLNGKYVLVLVDGLRVGGRIDGNVDLERLPVENIQRIEIVKGPAAALYGSDALGGVVNIITRKATRPIEGELTTRYGSYGSGEGNRDISAYVGTRQGNWNTRLSAGFHGSDGWDLSPGDLHTSASAHDTWNIASRSTLNLSDGDLSIVAEYVRKDLQGVDQDTVGGVFDRLNSTENAAVSFTGNWRPTKRTRLSTGVTHSFYRDQFAYDQHGSNELDTYEELNERLTTFTGQFDGAFGARHYVATGIDGFVESVESPRIFDFETGESRERRFRIAGFVQDEWRALDDPGIIVEPAVRLEYDTQYGFHPTPKLAVRWDATERVIVRGNYGRGYRAPDFKELYLLFENPSVGYVIEGNPELQPETSHSVRADVELRASDRVWAGASTFYNDFSEMISFDEIAGAIGQPTRYIYANIASARTMGFETQVRLTPRLGDIDGFRVDLSYAFTSTRDREEERPIPGIARHQASFKLSYEHPQQGVTVTVRGNVVGSRPFTFGDDDDEPPPDDDMPLEDTMADNDALVGEPFASIDVRLTQKLFERFTLSLGVENVANAGDENTANIQPRTFYTGLTARY